MFTGNYAYLDMTDQSGGPILYRSKHCGKLNLYYGTSLINVQLGIQTWSKKIFEDFLSPYQIEDGEIIFPLRELPATTIPELILSWEINTTTGIMHITNLFDTK